MQNPSGIKLIQWTTNGSHFITASDEVNVCIQVNFNLFSNPRNSVQSIVLWDAVEKKFVQKFPHCNILDACWISGDTFLSSSKDKTIKIWDADNFKVLQRIDKEENGHVNSVNSGFWDENSGMFISGSDDRSAIAWKIEKK